MHNSTRKLLTFSQAFALATFLTLLVSGSASASTYTYAGKTHASAVNPSKSNSWDVAASWTGGSQAFPDAIGDVAKTSGNVGGDVALYLNQDITLGSFTWYGNVLELWPGAPGGKFIVDNGGTPVTWGFNTPYWCWLNADMVLNDSLTVSNTTTIGASEPVRLNGVISGAGKLTLDWYGTSTHTNFIGVADSTTPNTYSGGTRLQGHATTGWTFEPRKNGAFGTGNVELNGYAILTLRNRGTTDDYIANAASLYLETANLTNNSHLYLEAGLVETIKSLYVDGVQQPAGTYGASGSGATILFDDFLSGPGQLIVTSGSVNPGAISNLPPSNVTATSATINGQLVSANAAPTEVRIYWGTTDGARAPSAWAHVVSLGNLSLGAFSTDISGYSAGQPVYYRCFLTNSLGAVWASKSVVIGPPSIQNELPYVRTNQVTLRGTITESNGLAVSTSVYWGTTDGGALPANWQNVTPLGVASSPSVATVVSGLQSNTKYYFRYFATNSAGSAWAGSSLSFTTVGPAAFGEIFFFVGSDPHYGYTQQVPDTDTVSRGALDRMNSLPGQNFPAAVGGIVGIPRGVLVVGDLTEGGSAAQWLNFTNDWGLNGERLLSYPLYEGYGNHDGGAGVVATSIKARNAARTGVSPSNISSNGYHYSWDWDFVHFVCLNLFPGDTAEAGFPGVNPQLAMQFLIDDLARNVGTSGRPVIIYHHYGFESFGAGWWSDAQRTNLYNCVSNYNIAAFINGHNHAITFTKWNGMDTYTDGTLGKATGNFMACRVTPTNFVAVERSPNDTWNTIYTKSITSPPLNPILQVSNGSGASSVTMDSAILNGSLVSTNDFPTAVWVYWGSADGGTSKGSWGNVIALGSRPLGAFSANLAGLAVSSPYYYRCYASNATSQAWSSTSATFSTLSGQPLVQNAAASNLGLTSATVNGSLVSTGSAPTAVWVYWGLSDGGTAKGNWPGAVALGQQPAGPLATTLNALAYNTAYYYRYYASNAAGESWAAPATSFTTLNPYPVVTNNPASGITLSAASLNGYLVSAGNAPASVQLYWGLADGGTVKANWASVIDLGPRSAGVLSSSVASLTSSTRYYYRFAATNSYGEAWAPATETFMTGGLGGNGGTWYWDKGGDAIAWAGINNWSNVTTHTDNSGYPNAPGTVATNLNGTVTINPSDVTLGELYCGTAFQLGTDVSPANILTFDNSGAPGIWRLGATSAGNVYNHINLASDLYITNTSTATLQIYRRLITGSGKNLHVTTLSTGGVTINAEDPATSYNTFSNLYLHANSVFTTRESARSPARSPLGTGTIYVEQGSTINVVLRLWATNSIQLLGNAKVTYSDDRAQGVEFDGAISGTGQLTFEHNDTSAAAGNFILAGTPANTYSGGTVVRGDNTANAFGGLVLKKNGATGTGDVILTNEFAKLQITDAGASAEDRISDTAALRLYHVGTSYAKVTLDANVNETVGGLYLDGVAQAAGTYGSTTSAAANKDDNWFSGSGILTVVIAPAGQPPVVANTSASAITFNTALLGGTLLSTGTAPTMVWAYYGSSDGGTTKANWAANAALGTQGAGPVSAPVQGLVPTTPYFYRLYASNSFGESWAPAAAGFTTLSSSFSFTAVTPAQESGRLVLKWESIAGKLYTVSQATNLVNPNWEPVSLNIPATPPINTYTTPPSPFETLFYRLSTQ